MIKSLQNSSLTCRTVQLVPFETSHIETYTRWLSDPDLLQLTGTEPLSLEEVAEVQRDARSNLDRVYLIITDLETEQPCGDVNVFFADHFVNGSASDDDAEVADCEIDVMIAEKSFRRRGIGGLVLRIMHSVLAAIGVTTIAAKINGRITLKFAAFGAHIRVCVQMTMKPHSSFLLPLVTLYTNTWKFVFPKLTHGNSLFLSHITVLLPN